MMRKSSLHGHYALRDGVDEPERDSDNPSAGDLGYLKYGVFPGDNGHFAIILCLPNNESELREAVKNGDKFDQICMNIPGLVPWISSDKAIPTTAPFGIGEIHAVWRDYIPSDTAPKLLNYFAVGDAAARTNPLYGRGCSTGTYTPTYLVRCSAMNPILGSVRWHFEAKPRKKSDRFLMPV